MLIAKVPLRISMFGGSTDYKSFYEEHGSFLIGTTIDKYIYLSMRFRPKFFPKESVFVYSKMDCVKSNSEVHSPLIREILKFKQVKELVEFVTFSDITSRMGLGGSSAFCVGLLYLINQLYGLSVDKKEMVKDAIRIERGILKEAGGIQDHIWPVYGGFNSIEINKDGDFHVKPMPVTEDFYKEFEASSLLIFTEEQIRQEEIAASHEKKDKYKIFEIAKRAYDSFLKEDIEGVGYLLYESWKAKRNLSKLISNTKIDGIIDRVMSCGAYGAKLVGSGGSGFIYCICNPKVKAILSKEFENSILDFKFESNGIYSNVKGQ